MQSHLYYQSDSVLYEFGVQNFWVKRSYAKNTSSWILVPYTPRVHSYLASGLPTIYREYLVAFLNKDTLQKLFWIKFKHKFQIQQNSTHYGIIDKQNHNLDKWSLPTHTFSFPSIEGRFLSLQFFDLHLSQVFTKEAYLYFSTSVLPVHPLKKVFQKTEKQIKTEYGIIISPLSSTQ